MSQSFLRDAAVPPRRGTLVLAHGASAAMDTQFMQRFAVHAAKAGLDVVRFEFGYMAQRRIDGVRRPPPKAETVVPEFTAALETVLAESEGPVLIGGKSMGGRVAAMVGGLPDLDSRVKAVVCLGYPFHPTGQPEKLRLGPLKALRIPALIVQGTRDPYGDEKEVATYTLPPLVTIVWSENGNHDLAPTGASPATWNGNIEAAAKAAAGVLG
ncbi:alpha/beta family hydrolase [Pseudoxanthobacter sp. M-2]|uniref:alpha/beta family hydrolase n=1 Tax=Pseudoxanthobacter sp. M-2 TaxID=3078754 RepID=UPI0038FC1225